jgi:hypothetical protein
MPVNYLKEVYNKSLRKILPRITVEYSKAGIKYPEKVELHNVLKRNSNPYYKIGFYLAIYDAVHKGDSVVIIGGGHGYGTVHVIRSGADNVTVYEASAEMLETHASITSHNLQPRDLDAIDPVHAVVGQPMGITGTNIGESISVDDIPDCDVLILDCEGCEMSILSKLNQRPRDLVVEVHEPETSIVEIIEFLEDRDYRVDLIPHRWGNLDRKYDIRASLVEYYSDSET